MHILPALNNIINKPHLNDAVIGGRMVEEHTKGHSAKGIQ